MLCAGERKLPLWIKLPYTAFLAVLIPLPTHEVLRRLFRKPSLA